MTTRMEKWAAKRAEIREEMCRASKAQLLDFVMRQHDYSSYKHAAKKR